MLIEGGSSAEQVIESVDRASAENSRSGSEYEGGIDTSKVADDPRITTAVIWNSGLLDDEDHDHLARLHAPIASPSAVDDWEVQRKNLGSHGFQHALRDGGESGQPPRERDSGENRPFHSRAGLLLRRVMAFPVRGELPRPAVGVQGG